jgi:hypothetical protein
VLGSALIFIHSYPWINQAVVAGKERLLASSLPVGESRTDPPYIGVVKSAGLSFQDKQTIVVHISYKLSTVFRSLSTGCWGKPVFRTGGLTNGQHKCGGIF